MRDPFDLAKSFLDLMVKMMTEAGSNLPATQYVSPGAISAYDGPQVTVNVPRVYAGQPGNEDAVEYAGFGVFSADFLFVVVRDTPVVSDSGAPPSTTKLIASAKENLADLENMTNSLLRIRNERLMGVQGMPMAIGPCTTEGPEGGVVAVVGRLSLPLL